MPTRNYHETPFYDFDRNYRDAVELIRRVFGEERAQIVEDERGFNTRSDFITAITWGWMFHRPNLTPQQRALVLIGNDATRQLHDALHDHVRWGLAEGLHREKIREAIFTLSLYSGIGLHNWASREIETLFAELNVQAWRPPVTPPPLPEIPERNFYDFEQNFSEGVDLSIEVFGESRGGDRAARLQRMGAGSVSDFSAIHWGWMMHRPFLTPQERVLVLIGSDSANKGYLALQDHVRWGLKEGLSRAEVQEAMFMLYLFNGWPANRQANNAVQELFEELDRAASRE
jgi:alkylhydroperoxidase/carboxymuconolactone decarboxylase family protein YurZ